MKTLELTESSWLLGNAGPLQLQAEEGGDAEGDGRKAGKKAFLISQESPAMDHFLSSAPRGPGSQGKFYLADQSIQVLLSCRGNIFCV